MPTPQPMVCKAFTEDEATRLVAVSWGWFPQGTVVLVGAHLGLRNEELRSMRWDGFDTDYDWYRLVGKGNRERTVAVPEGLAQELAANRNGSPWVFEGRFGGPVSHATINNWVAAVAESVGVRGKVNPHRLRHTFAATGNDETGDLRAVQDAMGHARPETTALYTRATVKRKRGVADAVAAAFQRGV